MEVVECVESSEPISGRLRNPARLHPKAMSSLFAFRVTANQDANRLFVAQHLGKGTREGHVFKDDFEHHRKGNGQEHPDQAPTLSPKSQCRQDDEWA